MIKRICAVTGEYQNQQGEQKAEFTNIGVIGVSQQGKEYVILDPAISLAGVLAKQQALAMKRGEEVKSNIMCSVFENTQQGQQPQQGYQQQQRPQQNSYQQVQNGNYQQGGNGGYPQR